MIASDDPFDLKRFIEGQAKSYVNILAELRTGQKRTHWMWYIFPQVDGLGTSATSKHYAIRSIEEAQQYLNHPVLGPRILECAEAVLAINGRSISEIMGCTDNLKLKSSMTLFGYIAARDSVFASVLDKYFHGQSDARTLHILKNFK